MLGAGCYLLRRIMVSMKKVAFDFVLGVAEAMVADYLIRSWREFSTDWAEFMRLRRLKAVHETSHVNCFNCEYVRSRWFWFTAPVEERKAVYSRYYQGSYEEGRWYQLPRLAAF